ncbi:hypothetical protein Sliba_57010 [Streptomyces nigrescens]|uniref:Uncharacterized protein n=1 Tax=Streptomyces nigrescens TaxID=1920 RepID=A0A640TP06_STRNI|nr:hypothetical protein Sliba_57010 [Streptomyces libani subsp. libani]GGW06150.1 hypothetical protein GCM10010500_72020 [Streptomyces libani subsp. libani]
MCGRKAKQSTHQAPEVRHRTRQPPARRRRNGENANITRVQAPRSAGATARHSQASPASTPRAAEPQRREATTAGKPKTWAESKAQRYVEPCQSSPFTIRPATIAPDIPACAGPPPGCDQPPTA